MSNTLAALVGGMSPAGISVQDVLDKAAPGLGFLPSFLRTWFKVDISQLIGLISLMGITSTGLEFLNRVAVKLYWWITRFCTATVSIAASDRLNSEVLNWLGAMVLTRQGTRVLAARSEKVDNDSWGWRLITERDDFRHERRRPVEYLPTFGTTWFFHRMRLFVVRRVPRNPVALPRLLGSGTPDEYAGAPTGGEPLVVMCLGRSVEPIKKFLEDCRDFSDHQREECITIRACKGQYGQYTWDTTILRPFRPIETVHFDEKIKEELVHDVATYLQPDTRRFYHQRGIPYRRGYLLHGPPGTGKTSLSLALAGIFRLELYLLHIPSLSSDKELETLFTSLPPRCIVLLEDIDAVGMRRKHISKDDDDDDGGLDDSDDEDEDDIVRSQSRTTLSGLLNVLDGVASQEGRIVLMTSNMADKLDPALVRPGRIDRKIYLGNISQESARLMFLRMYRPVQENELPGSEDKKEARKTAGAEADGRANPFGVSSRDDSSEPKSKPLPQTQPASSLLSKILAEKLNSTAVDISPEGLSQLAFDFSTKLPETTFTPAVLQGYLLSHRVDPLGATEKVEAWVAEELAYMEAQNAIAKKAHERRVRKRKEKQQKALRRLAREASSSLDCEAAAPTAESDEKEQKKTETSATTKAKSTEAAEVATSSGEVSVKSKKKQSTEDGAEDTTDEKGDKQATRDASEDSSSSTAQTNGLGKSMDESVEGVYQAD